MITLQKNALSTRLLIASALLLPMFLGLTGYMLDIAFRHSLLAAEQEGLKTHIYLLLGAAEYENNTLSLPESLTEPRFSQIDSGLYGYVYNQTGELFWQSSSSSLLLYKTTTKNIINAGSTYFNTIKINNNTHFQLDYDVGWETDNNDIQQYRFSVINSDAQFAKKLITYRKRLGWLLGSVGLLLIITQVLIMRWGLLPLKTLANDLIAIEKGNISQLAGNYPKEIQPITKNLNRVLATEKTQRERYRNTLTDLAHSLKTPLAVIRSGLEKETTPLETIDEQITRMDQIISHQLQRAVINSQQISGHSVAIKKNVTRIIEALNKVYTEKNMIASVIDNDICYFYGSEPDLMEMLGNIIENAYKYGRKKVIVSIQQTEKELEILIEDDGPGIEANIQHKILERGARADTIEAGQGIGLAVAMDIISSYRGSLEISKSTLGGAKFHIILPTQIA